MKDWDRVQVRLSPAAKKFLDKESKPRKWSETISSILEKCATGELIPASQVSGSGLLERVEILLRRAIEEEVTDGEKIRSIINSE